MKYLKNTLYFLFFNTLMWVIFSSYDLLFDFYFMLSSIDFSSEIIKNVDVSLFYLTVTTSSDTYKILNNPAIIALTSIIICIIELLIYFIIIHVKNKRKVE